MNRQRVVVLLGLVVGLGGLASVGLSMVVDSEAATESPAAAATMAAEAVLPGSSLRLREGAAPGGPGGGGDVLDVVIPAGAIDTVSDETRPRATELLWRASLVGGLAADERPSIVGLAVSGLAVSGNDVDEMADAVETVGSGPGSSSLESLGSVPDATIESQVAKNVATLRKVMGPKFLQDVAVTKFSFGPDAVAYRIAVTISNSADLADELGSLFSGLQTGLVSLGDDAAIDGLAIIMSSEDGVLAQSYVSSRTASSTLQFPEELDGQGVEADPSFTSITGVETQAGLILPSRMLFSVPRHK